MASIGPELSRNIPTKQDILPSEAQNQAQLLHADTEPTELLARWAMLSDEQRAEVLKILKG